MCRTAEASLQLFADCNRVAPRRSHATDGACPGFQHHNANPGSDHEPDWHLGGRSCAADVTHDPRGGCDAHGDIAERIRKRCILGLEWRVKYLIRHNFARGHDEICEPSTGWMWRDAHQNQHASHLHVSLVHDIRAVISREMWFNMIAPPPKKDDVNAEPVRVYPKQRLADGTRPTCLSVRGDWRATILTREQNARLSAVTAVPVDNRFFKNYVLDGPYPD
jgi:hypothetical protein